MANDKIYPIDMNSKDILLQNEGGGGMIMNDQFIGIVGNMLPDQKQLLDDQEYAGGTNIQTDKFSSNIIITNANSNPVGMNDLASKNFDSLDQSIGTNQVVAATPKDHCGGENLLNYEYQEISKNILSWAQLHTTTKAKGRPSVPDMYKPKNGVLEPKYYNDYIKSEDQLKAFLFDQPMTDIIKSVYTLDNSGFSNLLKVTEDNWTISNDVTNYYAKEWIHDESTDVGSLGMVKNKLKYFKNNNGTNKFESRSVFDVQVLPSGLRSFIFGHLSRINDIDWYEFLLVVIGPDYLNILTGLGLTKAQAFDDRLNDTDSKKFKKASTASQTQEKFFKEYEDIINAYNEDRTKFLNTLYKVAEEYTNNLTKYFLAPPPAYSQWFVDNLRLPYIKVQRNMALTIALKYADCPDEYEIVRNIPSAPTPSVSVAATATPTIAETNDDIYAAEFLPASEDETFQVFDDSEYADNKKVLDALADGTQTIVKIDPKVPPASTYNPSVKIDMNEISQWVEMASDVRKDWNNGWTNPNHPEWGTISINPYLLQSIASACKATGIKATITVSKTNHSIKAKGGADSRHWKGTGVDVGVLNGIRGYNKTYPATNKNNMVPEFQKLGTILYNQLVADGHAGSESLLGTDKQYEAGQDKSVLFMTQIGGNHYNHLHIGNRILSAPGVKPKVIRQ
jgi:hypothetical protein